jgi:hypothetical protein
MSSDLLGNQNLVYVAIAIKYILPSEFIQLLVWIYNRCVFFVLWLDKNLKTGHSYHYMW